MAASEWRIEVWTAQPVEGTATGVAGMAAWTQALAAHGMHVHEAGGRAALVHRPDAAAPDQAVAWCDAHTLDETLQALAECLASGPRWPVSLVSPELPADALQPLWAAGLAGWWPLHAGTAGWPQALAGDRARWQRSATLRAELERARAQLDERKYVDRAKGVLMSARGIGEDEAFRLLRGAAMHANLRVGEVSRSVIEASQWAEAINRAGQLRMLSQRIVKLAVQRLAGIDARRARALQDESVERARVNLAYLAACPRLVDAPAATQAALQAVASAWEALSAQLTPRLTAAQLAEVDRRAMVLLDGAEALTRVLEHDGGRRALRLVNTCGRQRARVQRLAKDVLLAALLAEPARLEGLTPRLDEIATAFAELEQAPLASVDTRQLLAAAQEEWLRLLRAIDAASSGDSRAVVAHAADSLLDIIERLTAAYEHSLQVIMS